MKRTIWLDPLMNEIVFEGRNKMYGAFLLRELYERNMLKGMVSGFIIFLLSISIPYILQRLNKDADLGPVVIISCPVELSHYTPPELTKTLIISTPKSPTPLKPQIKFIPPAVLSDEIEFIEADPPEVNKLNGEIIGTATGEEENGKSENGLYEDDGSNKPSSNIVAEPVVFESFAVNQQPEFPGGMKALYEYLKKELKFPALAKQSGISGTIVIQFIVSEDGQIKNATILRDLGAGLGQEGLRVVNEMPAWNPGKYNGKAVAVNFKLPIKFQLQ